jgi:hypothetical protein
MLVIKGRNSAYGITAYFFGSLCQFNRCSGINAADMRNKNLILKFSGNILCQFENMDTLLI